MSNYLSYQMLSAVEPTYESPFRDWDALHFQRKQSLGREIGTPAGAARPPQSRMQKEGGKGLITTDNRARTDYVDNECRHHLWTTRSRIFLHRFGA